MPKLEAKVAKVDTFEEGVIKRAEGMRDFRRMVHNENMGLGSFGFDSPNFDKIKIYCENEQRLYDEIVDMTARKMIDSPEKARINILENVEDVMAKSTGGERIYRFVSLEKATLLRVIQIMEQKPTLQK